MKRALSFRRSRKFGHHVRLHEGPMPPLLDPDGSPMPPSSPGASEPYGSLLDSLLCEQAALTQIMKGFEQQLHAGANGESLLCSSSFQEALARLGAAQQQQRELLSVARERIVRDYPMLLEASRALLELLSSVTSRANADVNAELPQVPTLSQTPGGPGGGPGGGHGGSHGGVRGGGERFASSGSFGRAAAAGRGGGASSDPRSDPRCV